MSRLVAAALLAGAVACGSDIRDPALEKPTKFTPDRPAIGDVVKAAPYGGSDTVVKEAQETLATGLELHAKVVYRTCTPNGGVCHNNKEYPDLRTPATFLSTIDAPCNVQPGTPEDVFDRCERSGDRFRLGDKTAEVGYVKYVPGEFKAGATKDLSTPGFHVQLADPVVTGDKASVDGSARFFRSFVHGDAVDDLAFTSFYTKWWVLDGGKHLVGQVSQDRIDFVQELASQVTQGDHNRNGKFGARDAAPIRLLVPGHPEESYLIARLRGLMKQNGADLAVPGTRMPLANQPLSIAEMLGLFCFVEGLGKQAPPYNMASEIDYVGCSYSKNPSSLNLLGAGVTWKKRVKQILDVTCAGCHSGEKPQGDLDLQAEGVYARLLKPSVQKPALPLITPKDPSKSYLWLKLNGDPSIVGLRMPFADGGTASLGAAELADIRAWIEAGAVENE